MPNYNWYEESPPDPLEEIPRSTTITTIRPSGPSISATVVQAVSAGIEPMSQSHCTRRLWAPAPPTITEEMRETPRSYLRPQEDMEQMERYIRILTSPPITPIPAAPPVTPPAPVDDVIRAGDTVVRLLGGSPLLRAGDTYRVASIDSYDDIVIEGSDGTFSRHYFKKVTSGRRERKLSGFGKFVKKLDSEDKINQSEGRQ